MDTVHFDKCYSIKYNRNNKVELFGITRTCMVYLLFKWVGVVWFARDRRIGGLAT
jgi:hypothetical protein